MELEAGTLQEVMDICKPFFVLGVNNKKNTLKLTQKSRFKVLIWKISLIILFLAHI